MAKLQEKASAASLPRATPPFVIYSTTSICPGVTPDDRNDDASCGVPDPCADNTDEAGNGPAARVFEALVGADGEPVDADGDPVPALVWTLVGITCLPELVPGDQPQLTMAQIQAAFHDTDFAQASVHLQPEGNVTLVTLPTYVEVRWPEAGFGPDEVDAVDPARMSGFRVDIRPRLGSVVYVFGDGSSSEATESLGGPYPTGDIRHSYTRAGTFPVRADITYGGQYRVNGGDWVDIPGDVTIEGAPQPLEVRTASNRLIAN